MRLAMARTRLLVLGLAVSVAASACGVVQQGAPAQEPAATPTATDRPSPTRRPEPTPSPGEEAVAAFVRRVTSGELRYRATFRGDARGSATIVTTRGTVDVVGGNYGLVVDFRFGSPASRTHIEHRYVGGNAWLRVGNRWRKFTSFIGEWSMSPFAAVVDDTDVTLEGIVPARGEDPERYRVEIPTGFFHPVLIPAANLTAEAIDRSRLELVIEANGAPVSGLALITARGRVGGQLQEIVVESRLTFEAIGSKRVVVRAP
jgi:hypothetical protein